MGSSFQEQLLKAGLVNKKQVKKAKHDKRITKQQKKGTKTPVESSIAREERLAHEERNRELNRKRNEEKKRREKLAQVKQLIETNRLTLKERNDDEPYYFVVGKRVKKLFLSEEISKQLTTGQLAIVKLEGKFELIPASAAQQVASRDPKSIVAFHDPSSDSPT
ncbi:MAG: DUF2058 domain-containing protein [Desulfobacterium sp.]|nr:DUF2058 domain-containing protein [Desulfobacterium sp.]